jgi:MFS transporter, PPP family, 3-phenylpropionic acid transporter
VRNCRGPNQLSNPQPGSTRDLNLTYVLVGATDATILPFIPLFLFERGFDASMIGVVLAAAALASFVAGPAWAYLADRSLGSERTVVIAGTLAAILALSLAAVNSTFAIGAVTVGLWVVRAPVMSLFDAITLQRLGVDGRSGYARVRLWMSAGWAVSVVVAGGLYQVAGLRLIPLVYAPMGLLLALWVWRVLAQGAASVRIEAASPLPRRLRLGSMPVALVGFLVSALLLFSAFAATNNFVTLRINVLGGGALLIGAAAAFQALTEIPTMAYTHVLMRFMSHRILWVAGVGVCVVVFGAWAFITDPLATALLKLVLGVGFALTYVASVLIADDVAPPGLRATAQSLVKAVSGGLAPTLGALGGGFVYGVIGPSAMFVTAAAVAAGAGVVALIALPGRDRAKSLIDADSPVVELVN